jgi:hypothetical protein
VGALLWGGMQSAPPKLFNYICKLGIISASIAELVAGHLQKACHYISSRLLTFYLSGITVTFIHSYGINTSVATTGFLVYLKLSRIITSTATNNGC